MPSIKLLSNSTTNQFEVEYVLRDCSGLYYISYDFTQQEKRRAAAEIIAGYFQ